eukprot:scaffold37220_cov79-Cyclotella_meneghiniana.AAC.1
MPPNSSCQLNLKSAQFFSLRFHLRARLIGVQKKSIFETVKLSSRPHDSAQQIRARGAQACHTT